MTKTHENPRGSILVTTLIMGLVLSGVMLSLMSYASATLQRSRSRILLLQAQYAAESGADSAIAELNNANETYTGTATDTTLLTNANLYKATYSVSVAAGSDSKEKIITAVGKVYEPASASTPKYTRTIQVTAQKSSASTSSSILSKNILETGSSVKDIKAQDIYINNYINLTKNVNNLIAENIIVADRFVNASNCSIRGSGSLSKPSSFTDPGQTKTTIRTRYNNCISPPGNTTNTNFDVTANDTSVAKVQSTLVPWNFIMDNTYQNSPTGCNDWTGSGNREIPSIGNTKKTHYPDDGSAVSTSCGTSGNIDLGSKTVTIHDHAHVRANLCKTSACRPTFNNDSGSLKYIFVEGSIHFDDVDTSPGSSPIVLVSYAVDPGTHSSTCPLGDAIYLGQQGSSEVNAPNLFLLAVNGGICLDKTKFGVAGALGGFSGKNIYIATNSGTPFDLSLNLSFPYDEIPVDLAWRAVRYLRL